MMNEELARLVARVALKSSAELEGLTPLLKKHCSQDEYGKLAYAIASVMAEIDKEILGNLYQISPAVKQKLEDHLKIYGESIL